MKLKRYRKRVRNTKIAKTCLTVIVFITFFILGNQVEALNKWNTQELNKESLRVEHYTVAIKAQNAVVSHYSNDYKQIAIQIPNRVLRCDIIN